MTFDDAASCAPSVQSTTGGRSLQAARVNGALRVAAVTAASLGLANCAQQHAGSSIDPRYGVSASPRVVAEGEAVPKGGGRDLVGRPYTVAGKTYYPRENPGYAAEGLASWYGSNFHGRLTANGEVFDRYAIAAAHTTMPLPSYARVTNRENGRSIIVRVNDRGPYHGNRVIDVSQQAAEALDFRRKGTAHVRVEYVGRASPHGSDDRILLSTLRTDGRPATLLNPVPTMVASVETRHNLPRQALALRSYETDQAVADEPVSARPAAAPAAAARIAPLPPERPLDLSTVPDAPVPLAGAKPAARPVVAGLSFTGAAASPPALGQGRSFQPLATKDVVGMNPRP